MKNGTHKYNDRVEICIPMQPITKKNSQEIRYRTIVKNGRYKKVPYIVPSNQFTQYQKDASFFLKSLHIDYPMNVEAHYYMKTQGVVDLSNLHEAIHDIMVKTGVIVDDEAYFIVSTDGSRVHYDKDNPRTELIITPAEPTFPMRKGLKEKFQKNNNVKQRSMKLSDLRRNKIKRE